MKPIRTRNDLLDLAKKFAPSRACGTALSGAGEIQCLGLFEPAFGIIPGWIIQIRSTYNRKWILAIGADIGQGLYLSKLLERVPWLAYQGEGAGAPGLRNGDAPKEAAYNRMKARAHARATQETAFV